MENSYECLESLIDYFANSQTNAPSLTITDPDTFMTMFVQETINVKNCLNRKSLIIENERNFELLIHQCQSLISFWLDKLFDAQAKGTCTYSKELFSQVTDELEALLSFIYHRYESFFNLDAKIPETTLKKIRDKLNPCISKLRRRIIKECGNETLTALALSPLTELLNNPTNKKITYRFIFYSRRIERALLAFNNENNSGICDDKPLIELMVFMNANSREAAHFIISKITANIEAAGNPGDQVDKLRFFLKEFNQCKERPNIAFRRSLPSLKEQIITWISEEIAYRVKRSLNFSENPEKPVAKEDKLLLSISAEVLTLITRAAKENNVVTNKHKTEVFKSISKYTSTQHAETLSVNSLIKKSYVVDRKAKDAAIEVLHGLIKRIHGY